MHVDDVGAGRDQYQQQRAVDGLQAGKAQRLVDATVELAPGNQRAGQRDRTDQATACGKTEADATVRLVAKQLDGRDRRLRAAAHAVRSEEHTSALQSLMRISYAVLCLKKKTHNYKNINLT